MSVKNEGKEMEMTTKEEDVDVEEGEEPLEEEEESTIEGENPEDRDVDVPMFVFLWTYKPWNLKGNFTPLFLTHSCMFCAFGVLLCNYGYEGSACTWLGLCGFVSCIFGMSKIQSFSQLKGESEVLKVELAKMRKLMGKFESENEALKQTLEKLQEQTDALRDESAKLTKFSASLNLTMDDYDTHVKEFRRERKKLEGTFTKIEGIVETLSDKEVDLQKRCTKLKVELQKLRQHNKAIAVTYNNLVEEHENVQQTNETMREHIEKFEEMRQTFIDQRDVLKNSMVGNLSGMNTMMQNYEILYLQEIAHNTEFLDGNPGMTADKYWEFIRRIPANMEVAEDKLIGLFEELADDDMVCDHTAMCRIVVEIVKVNAGVRGALSGGGGRQPPEEKASVVDL